MQLVENREEYQAVWENPSYTSDPCALKKDPTRWNHPQATDGWLTTAPHGLAEYFQCRDGNAGFLNDVKVIAPGLGECASAAETVKHFQTHDGALKPLPKKHAAKYSEYLAGRKTEAV